MDFCERVSWQPDRPLKDATHRIDGAPLDLAVLDNPLAGDDAGPEAEL